MIGQAPTYPWTPYEEEMDNLYPKSKQLAADGLFFKMQKLRPDAPDEIKCAFEEEMNARYYGLRRAYTPEIDDPYYTWDGKIVERSALSERKLPLAQIGGHKK